MATALYATALALTQVTEMPFWICAIVMGVFTTVYPALGGMKAVIWTDVAQFFIFMFAIVFFMFKCVAGVPGGTREVWNTASRTGHLHLFDFAGGLKTFNTQGVLIGGTFLILISYGVDQIIIQRYLSACSIDQIKRGMLFPAWFTPLLMWSLALIGLSVLSFYTHFSERLPAGLAPDKWFPHFIAHELPVGASGIVIAGQLASSIFIGAFLRSARIPCNLD